MIKHDYKDKKSTETTTPATGSHSGSRMSYDARRVAAEKNTMRVLEEKRENTRDPHRFETTTDMIAFQPKNKAAGSERAGSPYPRSDVERNIDEAERYIKLITTQKTEKPSSPSVEKTHKPLPTTTEISAFTPKTDFEDGTQAPTTVFSTKSHGAYPTEDAARTRSFRVGDADDGQTRAYRVGGADDTQTRAYRVGGADDTQTRAYRAGGADDTQTRAYRAGGADDGQTRAYRVGGADDSQTRAYRVGGKDDDRTRSFVPHRGTEAPTEIYDTYSGRMIELTDRESKGSLHDTAEIGAAPEAPRVKKENPVRFEYTSTMQNERIQSDMNARYKNVKLRLGLSVLLAVLLFLIENIAPIAALFPSRFLYITADWVLAFACIFLLFDRLGNAFKSFFSRAPEVDCVTILAFLFSVAATAVALIFEKSENVITLYNFPLAVCVFLNLLFVYYRLRRDIYSFDIISSYGEKQTVVLGNSKEDFLSDEEYFIHSDRTKSVKFGEVKRVNFIDGYFAHSAEAPNAQVSLKIFIPFCLIASAVFFCCSLWTMQYSVPESLGIAYATFMICAPCSVFLNYCYPLYLASRHARNYNSAILCDKTPDEYRDLSMVIFRDTEAIPAGKAKVKSIRLYGDKKIDRAIYYASSIYSAVGGPLADVFRNAAVNSVSSENVQIREISNDGVCAMVDGKNIVIGRPAYMEEQCFETMNETGDDEYDGKTNKRIIYLACDQFIIAKFYIQYAVGADFLNITERLFSAGVGISVRTADPSLDDGIFYENKIDPEQHAIRISGACLKEKDVESVSASRAGIVSTGSVKDLIKALLLCKRLENVRRTNLVLNVVASVFAVAVMALVLFTGNATGMYSVYPALYQLFWILPTYFVSKVYL